MLRSMELGLHQNFSKRLRGMMLKRRAKFACNLPYTLWVGTEHYGKQLWKQILNIFVNVSSYISFNLILSRTYYVYKSNSSVIKNGTEVMKTFWFIRIYYTLSCICEVR
jgi:hypothetical protein